MTGQLKELKLLVNKFRDERDWKQFHTPKNLSMALSVEASELSELFLWVDSKESVEIAKHKIDNVEEEMADIFIYLLSLSDVLNIDLEHIVQAKIEKNNKKYPVEKSKGNAKKYTEL